MRAFTVILSTIISREAYKQNTSLYTRLQTINVTCYAEMIQCGIKAFHSSLLYAYITFGR